MLERLALLEVEVTTPVSVEVPLVVAVVLRVSVLVLVEVVLENVRVVVRDLSFPAAVAKSAWETPTSPTCPSVHCCRGGISTLGEAKQPLTQKAREK